MRKWLPYFKPMQGSDWIMFESRKHVTEALEWHVLCVGLKNTFLPFTHAIALSNPNELIEENKAYSSSEVHGCLHGFPEKSSRNVHEDASPWDEISGTSHLMR